MQLENDERIIAEKLANGLYANARINAATESVTSALGLFRSMKGGIDVVARYHRGYWVGGRATLTSRRLLFSANAMNGALQDDIDDIAIPLRDITSLGWRWGVLTGIIDVATGERTFSLRCFGAKGFAKAINFASRELAAR